jgi:hypothetical protein
MTELYLIIPFFLIIALATGFVLCRMMCELCSRYTWKGVYMGYCACILLGLIITLIFKDEIITATSIFLTNFPLLRNIRI